MSSRLRSSARHHVVALAGAAPRNAQLALIVWRGRRRASPLNRLSCPVLCVFSGYVRSHHSFCHQAFISSSSILIVAFGMERFIFFFFLLLCCNLFLCISISFDFNNHPPTRVSGETPRALHEVRAPTAMAVRARISGLGSSTLSKDWSSVPSIHFACWYPNRC